MYNYKSLNIKEVLFGHLKIPQKVNREYPLVVNDLFGGEILKTKVLGCWHYYNRINGFCYGITSTQYKAPCH
ncbi:YunG family protein [Niallia taxi]